MSINVKEIIEFDPIGYERKDNNLDVDVKKVNNEYYTVGTFYKKNTSNEVKYCDVIGEYVVEEQTSTQQITKKLPSIIKLSPIIEKIAERSNINIIDLIKASITHKSKDFYKITEKNIDKYTQLNSKDLIVYDVFVNFEEINQTGDSFYNISILYFDINVYLFKQKIAYMIKQYLKNIGISADVYFDEMDDEVFISLNLENQLFCIGKWNNNSNVIKIPYVTPCLYIQDDKIEPWLQEDYFKSFQFKYMTYSTKEICDLTKEELLSPMPLEEINRLYMKQAEDIVNLLQKNLGIKNV